MSEPEKLASSDEPIISMLTFKGHVYFATPTTIYRLEEPKKLKWYERLFQRKGAGK